MQHSEHDLKCKHLIEKERDQPSHKVELSMASPSTILLFDNPPPSTASPSTILRLRQSSSSTASPSTIKIDNPRQSSTIEKATILDNPQYPKPSSYRKTRFLIQGKTNVKTGKCGIRTVRVHALTLLLFYGGEHTHKVYYVRVLESLSFCGIDYTYCKTLIDYTNDYNCSHLCN